MRLLIWCLCAFVFEMVHIKLNKSGFHFGFLEAFIFYGLLFYTATNLSNKLGAKWENSRLRKKAEKEGMSPAEYAKKDIPKMFLLEIENRLFYFVFYRRCKHRCFRISYNKSNSRIREK